MIQLTDVVKNLIIINVIIFFGTMVLPLPDAWLKMGHLYFPTSDMFRPFQIVTSMFMHADLSHLFFNMLGLLFLGPMVEQVLGPKRFFILYILGAFVAVIFHAGIDWYEYYKLVDISTPENFRLYQTEGLNAITNGKNYVDPTLSMQNARYYNIVRVGYLGASGAVYAVIIAFVTMFPTRELSLLFLPIRIPAVFIGIVMVGTGLYYGFGNFKDGIAHFAHIGGAIAGFLLVHFWKKANLQ